MLAVEVDGERELRSVVQGLSRTVLFCPTETRTGVYAPDNVILFLVGASGDHSLSPLARSVVFADPEVRRHARVAVASWAQPPGRDKIAMHRYNVFAGRIETTNVYAPREAALSVPDLFLPFPMEVGDEEKERERDQLCVMLHPATQTASSSQDYEFRAAFLPWSFFGSADYIPQALNPEKAFENHTGAEIEAVESVCQVS